MKYLTLFNNLEKDIENGVYPVGSLIPHTKDLIEKYGVSLTTVSRAVKLLQRQGYVNRIKSKGTFVLDWKKRDYLELRKPDRVGLLLDGYLGEMLDRHYFVQAFRSIESCCSKVNKSVVVIARENRSMEDYLEAIKAMGISGLFVYSYYDEQLFNRLRKMKLPLVYFDFIDHNLPVDQVTLDHSRAGAIALKKLLDLGHRNILFLGNYDHRVRNIDVDHYYWWQGIEGQYLQGFG
jgi:DNA-binding LacI/PurR family transcriptional regulator